MRALLYRRFGPPDVLEVGELEPPRPGRGEVLVRVRAAGLNPKDVLVRKGKFTLFTGRTFPRVPGYDLSGEVAALGEGARGFRVGQPVFGMINRWAAGACAEYVALPETELAPRPRRLVDADAAAVPLAALTSLQALRDLGRVGPDQRVLINGASGGVGTLAIQIAKIYGARVVTTSSARNADLCRDLGADTPLDYAAQDPLASGPYDVIYDVFGNLPYARARASLTPRGRYITTIPKLQTVAQDILTRFGAQPARLVVVRSKRPDLETLSGWIEQLRLRPVVDRTLPLAEGADAMAYLETKRARGKVVLTLDDRA